MYVLVIGRSYPDAKTGMMGIFEFEQARALQKISMKVVYAFCDTRSVKSLRIINNVSFIKDNVDVYGFHLPIGGMPRRLFELVKENRLKALISKIISEQGVPDIIHVHYPLLNLTIKSWEMLKDLEKPIVITEHWSKVQTMQIEPYRVELLRKVVKESDSFLCVGDPLRKSIVELTESNKQIGVLPNMVNPIFSFEKREINDRGIKFIAIGRLVELKRFDLVIDAFSEAFANNTDIKLHIVGNGPLFNEMQMKIKELQMDHSIIMHGFLPREETAKLLKNCDAYVSASVLETFGVPYIEALACGKPVIGAKEGAIDRYITNSNGILFEKNNKEELVNALETMVDQYDQYNNKEIARNAESIFSERAIIEELKKIYVFHDNNNA